MSSSYSPDPFGLALAQARVAAAYLSQCEYHNEAPEKAALADANLLLREALERIGEFYMDSAALEAQEGEESGHVRQ